MIWTEQNGKLQMQKWKKQLLTSDLWYHLKSVMASKKMNKKIYKEGKKVHSHKHLPECCTASSYFKFVKSAFCIICLKFIWNSTTFENPIISQLSLPCKEHKLWWKTFLDTCSNFVSNLRDCCVYATLVRPNLPTGKEKEQDHEVIGKNRPANLQKSEFWCWWQPVGVSWSRVLKPPDTRIRAFHGSEEQCVSKWTKRKLNVGTLFLCLTY